MDLVSVIIPYYKKIRFINKSISSVLEQTYPKIEIIIIYDDEDKSELEFLVKQYKSNDKIKIIINEENIGAGLSRNKAIKYSNGKYICFLDADDCWKKEKIETQINFMIEKNFKISHTSYDIIDEENKFIRQRKAKTFTSYEDILTSCDIGLSTVILDKKIFSENIKFANLKTKEDFVLWIKILQKNIFITSLNQTLTSWRKIDNSLSSSIIQKLSDAFKVYNYYMKFNFIKSFYYTICLSINFLKK